VPRAARGVACLLRARMPGVVVMVATRHTRALLPSVRRLWRAVVVHQRTTPEADLCCDPEPPCDSYEPLADHVPRPAVCIASGCSCAGASSADDARGAHCYTDRRVCGFCGHVAGDGAACMLCGCSVCADCAPADASQLRCSCGQPLDHLAADLSGQTVGSQFQLDRVLFRTDGSVAYAVHVDGVVPASPDVRWDRGDSAGGAGGADAAILILSRVHTMAMLHPLMHSPGILSPARTGCAGGMAFAVYLFGGTRVAAACGAGGDAGAGLATALQTLWTLAIVCGSLLSCGLMIWDISLADFVAERAEDGALCVRLQLAGSAPMLLRSVLPHAGKQRLSQLMCQLAELIASLAGPTLTRGARSELRALVECTALTAGSLPVVLGGGQFDVACLEPSDEGPEIWRAQCVNRMWLELVARHAAAVLSEPLRSEDALPAGAWADAYRVPLYMQ
jgi:hypothetical protein